MILELGAGCGLVGLYCLRDSKPKKYIFSDHHDLVLNQLESNLKLNYDKDCIQSSIIKLDWINTTNNEMSLKELDLDYILASGLSIQ